MHVTRRLPWMLLLAAVLVSGCPRAAVDRTSPVADPAGYEVRIAWRPFALSLHGPSGQVLTQIDPGGLGIGRVDAFARNQNYDPFLMVHDLINGPSAPPGLTWIAVQEVTAHETVGGAERFAVRLDDGSAATLVIEPVRGGTIRLALAVPEAGREVEGESDVVYTYADLRVGAEEQFYGLGQVFQSVAHRGRTIAMQMALYDTESFNNEAHVRIPLLISTRAWGLFANSMRPGYFDVADRDPDRVRVVFNDPALQVYLLAGREPLEVTERYVDATAPPAIPPVWAFAPIQWRNVIAGQDVVLQDATDIRANGVPTGAIWIDRPYQSGYNTMDFDPVRYPDPPAMVDRLHAMGFRLAGWNTPYLADTDPEYAVADQNGYFAGGVFPFQDFGRLLDLTHPEAMTLWQGRVTAALARGIEGWKLDYAEDIQIGFSGQRLFYTFYSGEDERTMNRRYAEYYHRAYAEPLGLPEVFIIARAGTIGGQQYASVIWPGDLDSDFADFGELRDGTVHVGGLPSAVRAGSGLSVSGYPFFASDTGGFRHERPTHEVMVRWTEYAALLPIMQYGGGGENHNPWDFTDYGASHFTRETLDLFNRYARLHIQLFPYFYTYARAAHDTGRPVIRPFGLAYPADGRHPDDVFLSGPDLLVAPLMRGGTQRTVPLPAGRWIDWWTGEALDGPRDLPVTAPLGTLPLYLRDGATVPMLRPTVVTLSPATDAGIDTYDGNPGRVWGRVVPAVGVDNQLVLHDGSTLGHRGDSTGGATVWFEAGSGYDGLRLRVYAPATTAVDRGGVAIAEATDATALDSCTACWRREGTVPWVQLSLAPGTSGRQTFTLR